MSSTTLGECIKRNQIIWIIKQNIWFRCRPKFRLNNRFQHNQGQNQISNFSFWLNRNQKLIFCFRKSFLNTGYLFEILYNFIFVIESNIIPNGRNISSKVSNIWLDWTISCYPNLLVLLAELVNEILTSKFLLLIKLGRFHPIFFIHRELNFYSYFTLHSSGRFLPDISKGKGIHSNRSWIQDVCWGREIFATTLLPVNRNWQ